LSSGLKYSENGTEIPNGWNLSEFQTSVLQEKNTKLKIPTDNVMSPTSEVDFGLGSEIKFEGY
jgi:hypothetical protein